MTDDNKLLDEALARGVITDEQRMQMAAMQADQPVDPDEKIRVVSNLNEIFVTFGTILMVNAASGLLAVLTGMSGYAGGFATAFFAIVAALYFHRGKRFRLPIIYCILSAAGSVGVTLYAMLHHSPAFATDFSVMLTSQLAALAILIAGAAYFRTPFIMLPIGILFAVITTMAAKQMQEEAPMQLLLGSAGLMLLAVAVYFDLKDPLRQKRWSDFAFWSYAVGSPLFVHSLFLGLLLSDREVMPSMPVWLAMLALAVGITFAGLLLNRRALILSTLVYVGIILFRLISGVMGGQEHGSSIIAMMLSGPTILLVTLLVIGLYVVLLGSRWPRVRRALIRRLPRWRVLGKLPA